MEDLRLSLKALDSEVSHTEQEQHLRTISDYKNKSNITNEFLDVILNSHEGALKIINKNWSDPNFKPICKKLLEIIEAIVKNKNESLTKVQVDEILITCQTIVLANPPSLTKLCCSIIGHLSPKLYNSNIEHVALKIFERVRGRNSNEAHYLFVLGAIFEHCPNQVKDGSSPMWISLVHDLKDILYRGDMKLIDAYVECLGRLLKYFAPPRETAREFWYPLKKLILRKDNKGLYYKKYLVLFEKSLDHVCEFIFADDFKQLQDSLFDQLDKKDAVELDSPLMLACEKLHITCLNGVNSHSIYPIIWNHLWSRLSLNVLKVYEAKCLTHFAKKPLNPRVCPSVSKICRSLTICCARLNKKKDEQSYMRFCFCLESLFTFVGQDESLYLKYRGTLENFALFQIMMYQRSRHYMPSSLMNCLIALPDRERFMIKSIVFKAIVLQCSHKWLVSEVPNLECLTQQNFSELWSTVLFAHPTTHSSEMTHLLFDVFMESILRAIDSLDFKAINGRSDVTVSDPDVTFFENLVSLVLNTFSNRPCDRFEDWCYMFLEKTIDYSMRFPLVCGFHKLMTLGLRLIKPFDVAKKELLSRLPFQDYLDFVVDNILGYKGQLFQVCMAVITSVSADFVRHSVDKLVTPFQIWFSIAHSSPILAKESITAIYSWLIDLGHGPMSNLLNGILPFLRPLLKFCHGKSPLKNLLQTEFIKFIACLTTEQCNNLMLQPAEFISLKTSLIDLKFEFMFTNLQIKLEDLINPIIFLATESNDETETMEAHYLLGLIPLIMLDVGSRSGNFEEVKAGLGQMIPVLLNLACESANGSYFAKLIFQLVHLTVNESAFRAFNVSLMNSLIEKLLSTKNPAVVELCLSLLKNYVRLLKKSDFDQNNDGAIEIILSAVANNLLNDDFLRRRGASQIFNTVAEDIFYKNYFIENFSMRLGCIFIKSLSIYSHEMDEITISLHKLRRIISENIWILTNPSKTHSGMQDIEDFLLEHCSSMNLQCSRESQSFLLTLLSVNNSKQSRFSAERLIKSLELLEGSNDLSIFAWHSSLLASLNYYSWLIRNEIAGPDLPSSGMRDNILHFVDYHFESSSFETLGLDKIKNLRKDIIVSIFGLLNSLSSSKELLDELCRTEKFIKFFLILLIQPSELRVNFHRKEHSSFIGTMLLPLSDSVQTTGLEYLNNRVIGGLDDFKVALSVSEPRFNPGQLELIDSLLVVSKCPIMRKIMIKDWSCKISEVSSLLWCMSVDDKKSLVKLDKSTIGGIASLIQLCAVSDEHTVDKLWEFISCSSSGTLTIHYTLLRLFEDTVLHMFFTSGEKSTALLTRLIKSLVKSYKNIEEIVYFVQFILSHDSTRNSSMSQCISRSLEECYDCLAKCFNGDRMMYLVETLYLLATSVKTPLFFVDSKYEILLKDLSSMEDNHLVFKCFPYFTESFDASDSEMLSMAKDGLDLGVIVLKDENLILFALNNIMMSVDEFCELIDVIKMLPSVDDRMLLTILNGALQCCSKRRADASFRIRLVKSFVVPLIFELSKSSLNEFFNNAIDDMYKCIKSPVQPEGATVDSFRDEIIDKIISFMLTEIMIDLIPFDDLFSESSFLLRQLGKAAFDGYKREMLEKARDVLETPICVVPPALKDSWWNLNCVALNTIAILLRKRGPTDERLTKFIFNHSLRGDGTFTWITPIENYVLPSYDTVRSEGKNNKKIVVTSQKFKKIAVSQSLDLTPSIASQECKLFDFIGLKMIAKMDSELSSTEIPLSNDDIDSHESMGPLCRVILDAVKSAPAANRDILPKWMESLRKTLVNTMTPQNARVFILRIVYNCRSSFIQYASHWIGSILLCLSLPPFKDGQSHFFIQLILMLTVSWKEACNPNSVRVGRQYGDILLSNIIRNCEAASQTGSTASFKILRKIIDAWGTYLTVPHDEITDMLGRCHVMALKVCSVMYETNIAPFKLDTLNLDNGFLYRLFEIWKTSENKTEILRSSSQLMGYVLWSLRESHTPENIQKEQKILAQVVLHLNATRPAVVHYILHIQKYYPFIVDRFASTLVTQLSDWRLSSLHSSILEIIDVHTTKNPDCRLYEQLQETIPFTNLSDKVQLQKVVLNIHSHFSTKSFHERMVAQGILRNIMLFIGLKNVDLEEKAIAILVCHYRNIKKNNTSEELLNYIESNLLGQMYSAILCRKQEKIIRFFAETKLQNFDSLKPAVLFLFNQKDIFADQNALQILVLLFIQLFDQTFDTTKSLLSSPVFEQQNVQEHSREDCQFWRKVPNYVDIYTSESTDTRTQSDIDVSAFLRTGHRPWLANPSKFHSNKLLRPNHEAVYSDLMSSITHLIVREDVIAGIIFKQFINDLLLKLSKVEMWNQLKIDLSISIKAIFEENEIKSASLASALLDLLYMNDIPCSIVNLASVSWRKCAPEVGILLSERGALLARNVPDEQISVKKQCVAADSCSLTQFLLIYSNLDETDIVADNYRHLIEINANHNDPLLKSVEYTKMSRSLGDWNYLRENLNPHISDSILDVKSSTHAMLDSFVTSEFYHCISSSQNTECILKSWLMDEGRKSLIESCYPYLSLIFDSNESTYSKARTLLEEILRPSLTAKTFRENQDRPFELSLKILFDMFMFSISNTDDNISHWPLIQKLRVNNVCGTDHFHLFIVHQTFRLFLLDKCRLALEVDRSDELESLEMVRRGLIQSLIDTSLAHSNIECAKKHLEVMFARCRSLKSTSASNHVSFLLSRNSLEKHKQADNRQTALGDLDLSWKTIKPVIRSQYRSFELYSHLSKLFESYTIYPNAVPKDVWELPIWSKVDDIIQPRSTKQSLINFGLKYLVSAVDLPDCSQETAHYELASFCDRFLSDEVDESQKLVLTEILIKSVFRSMALGNKQARMLFLTTLKFPYEVNSQKETFIKESSQAPAWMFLEWLPQILAYFNSPSGRILIPLMYRMFSSFPHQVRMSFELFLKSHRTSISNLHDDSVIHKLQSCLRTENYDLNKSFFECVALVRHPRLVLNNCIRMIMKCLKDSSKLESEMLRNCFEKNNVNLGRAYRVNDVYYIDIEKALDLRKTNQEAGNEELEIISQKILESSTCTLQYSLLEDYSPKLANLSWTLGNIQIPDYVTSYFFECKPNVSIVRFDPKVEMLPSLRKPVKISFIGSDGNRHSLLVKSGEDLRQDQLCQQCFQLFNSAFSLNMNSNLKIHTYNVIPIASEVGLIEWIDNTSTISSLINKNLSVEHLEIRHDLRGRHAQKMFSQAEERKQEQEITSESYLRDIELIHKEMNPLASQLPSNLLNQSLCRLSSSPTHFYNIRVRFMRSYAALCGAHWILGVSDRHPSNCLIDLNKGEVIGIDFGQTFGARVQFGFMAELVPFRMTRNFYHVYDPFFVEGVLCAVIKESLKGIRTYGKTLINALEVCRMDPTDNMKSLAQLIYKNEDESMALASYYESIVTIIRRKLDPNEKPSDIIITQLRTGTHNATLLKLYHDLMDKVDQSHDTVKSLLNIATNNYILSACHYNYEPWL